MDRDLSCICLDILLHWRPTNHGLQQAHARRRPPKLLRPSLLALQMLAVLQARTRDRLSPFHSPPTAERRHAVAKSAKGPRRAAVGASHRPTGGPGTPRSHIEAPPLDELGRKL